MNKTERSRDGVRDLAGKGLASAMSCAARRAPSLSFGMGGTDLGQPWGINEEVPNDAETMRVSAGDGFDIHADNSRRVSVKDICVSGNDGNQVDIWTAVYGTWEALYTLSNMGM